MDGGVVLVVVVVVVVASGDESSAYRNTASTTVPNAPSPIFLYSLIVILLEVDVLLLTTWGNVYSLRTPIGCAIVIDRECVSV